MSHDIELKEYNILEDAVFIIMTTKVDLDLLRHLDSHLVAGLPAADRPVFCNTAYGNNK